MTPRTLLPVLAALSLLTPIFATGCAAETNGNSAGAQQPTKQQQQPAQVQPRERESRDR